MGLDARSFAGGETGRQLAVLAVGEVKGRAAAPAHRVAGRGRPEDPVPGPQRRPLGRQAHAADAVADGAARFEGGVQRQLERGEPVGSRDAGGDELVERRGDRPRVPRREVGVAAGPRVNPAPVVAVAAGVELGRGQRQPVERQQTPPIRVQRGQQPAEVGGGERTEFEGPRLVRGPATRATHPPALVGPAVAVADNDEAPGRRGGGERPQRGIGNRGAEGGQPAHPQHVSSRDHLVVSSRAGGRPAAEQVAARDHSRPPAGPASEQPAARDHSWPPTGPAAGRRRNRSLPAIDASSVLMESLARKPSRSASSPGAAASSRSPRA